MNISALKQFLATEQELQIELPNGTMVPAHFHVTEMGLNTKHFIDCGGTIRQEKLANLQVWTANDTDHRLAPSKFLKIIALYEHNFGDEDLDIEVEFQSDTIGKYGVELKGNHLLLTTKQTNCLAQDHCGIPADKLNVKLSDLTPVKESACCTPGGGCC